MPIYRTDYSHPGDRSRDYFHDYVQEHIKLLGVNPDSFDWEDQVEPLRAAFLTPLEVAKRILAQA